jgi:hypothetical protein
MSKKPTENTKDATDASKAGDKDKTTGKSALSKKPEPPPKVQLTPLQGCPRFKNKRKESNQKVLSCFSSSRRPQK